ncbi:hypothetical protein Hypma_008650 [Hypsizygus marmoreus]|uniref:Uncharacterized protein n=1 Tax=Hypsizygus marmoreus TaxID=39966 RepID=A0A369JS94_HYPMA|nr:hypothetical protein Hypma_008650 [Hypsizygus marmoreus]
MSASKATPYAALETLLKGSTPEKIQSCLLQSMKKASIQDIDTLSALLAPLASQADTTEHCVRCHAEYTENTNHPKACKIEHGEGDGERTRIGDDAITMTLDCCGIQFDSEEEPPTPFCILARHTINPDQVVYYDGDKGEGNEHVVTCEEFGCKKKRKKAATSNTKKAPAKKRK